MQMIEPEIEIEVNNLVKFFPIKEGIVRQKTIGNVHAVDNISFKVFHGETLGLVGESGCGKTTTGRMLLRLIEPTSGNINIRGLNISEIGEQLLNIKWYWSFVMILFATLFYTLSVSISSQETYLFSTVGRGSFVLYGAYQEVEGELLFRPFDWLGRLSPELGLFYALLFIWIVIFLGSGIIALALVCIPPIYNLLHRKPPNFDFVKTGVGTGLIGSGFTWVLMIMISLFQTTEIFDEVLQIEVSVLTYTINYLNLGITAVGWVFLIAAGILWGRLENKEERNKVMHDFRKSIQMIFQDPYSSLNPRMTVYDIISEGMDLYELAVSQKEKEEKVLKLMDFVGLAPFHIYRYPHEFSGGQRQRIGIARALSVNPQILVADEPVSALDVSIRAQILNLLDDLQKELGLTYIIIAHDLSVIRHVSDRVAVMYVGKLVEIAETTELFENPTHPYTHALMSAVPLPDPTAKKEAVILRGDVPTPVNPKPGCRFKDRCIYAKDKCNEDPLLSEITPGHFTACWFPL
jgi:oligopeptide/dipeptide ABC transporter ATP-binding protein